MPVWRYLYRHYGAARSTARGVDVPNATPGGRFAVGVGDCPCVDDTILIALLVPEGLDVGL